jgi:hypothetical protein
MSAHLLFDLFQQYLEISVAFALCICIARCNNSTIGNENDFQGLLYGSWGGGGGGGEIV